MCVFPRRRSVAVLLAAVLAAACGGAPETAPTPAASTPTPSANPTTTRTTADAPVLTETPLSPDTTPVASATTPSQPEPKTVEIAYRDGEVQVERSPVMVTLGEQVVLEVGSDVADHVHVHGYDLMTEVGPGGPSTLEFTAELPGVFEVELEDAGVRLVELQVQ